MAIQLSESLTMGEFCRAVGSLLLTPQYSVLAFIAQLSQLLIEAQLEDTVMWSLQQDGAQWNVLIL